MPTLANVYAFNVKIHINNVHVRFARLCNLHLNARCTSTRRKIKNKIIAPPPPHLVSYSITNSMQIYANLYLHREYTAAARICRVILNKLNGHMWSGAFKTYI